MSTADVLILTKDAREKRRIEEVCGEFSYAHATVDNFEAFMESPTDAQLVYCSSSICTKELPITEVLQALKQLLPTSFIIVSLVDKLDKEMANLAKKYGAEYILLYDEIFNTSKVDFAVNQVLKANYIPIKAIDLKKGMDMPFDVYHLMPSRKKFVRAVIHGTKISENKFNKMNDVKELYVHRLEAKAYSDFIASQQDLSAAGLAKRCRVNFLALYADFTSLVFSLTDQSEGASFGEGQKLIHRCQELCKQMLNNLAEFPDAWEIINGSAIGEFGSVERAPAISAYCGLLGIRMDVPQIDQIMLGALLADLGILHLPSKLTAKMRENEDPQWSTTEFEQFKNYPSESLSIVLAKRLSIEEKLRAIIVSTQERADGKGYPKGIAESKLTGGAQLIHFARMFDQKTLLRMGRLRSEPKKVIQQMAEQYEGTGLFTSEFMSHLKKSLAS